MAGPTPPPAPPSMPPIYGLAWDGTLGLADLEAATPADLNWMDPDTMLTPLGAAVWAGQKRQVKLLLRRADPDGGGAPGARPPLWVAAARTERHASRIVEMLLGAGADPGRPSSIDEGSTPLLAAVKAFRHPDLIGALVDAGADPAAPNDRGETAHSVATQRRDRAILRALRPRGERSSGRLKAVLVFTGLMLFIVAWANQHFAAAAAIAGASVVAAGLLVPTGAVKERFKWSGVFSPMVPSQLQGPSSVEQFTRDIRSYIEDKHLDRFFPPNSRFLDTVVERTLKLGAKPRNVLDPKDLARLALYQPVIYCDDSGSMQSNGRRGRQDEIVQRIAGIATCVVPDGEGVELRFINMETTAEMTRPDRATIAAIMRANPFDGWTEIGTNLERKILEPMVYAPLRTGGALTRPLLISILTDGIPDGPKGSPEQTDSLRNAIQRCGEFLRKEGYEPNVVRFHISQIGDDTQAKKFLKGLIRDDALQDVLYCTAERLDEKFQTLRDNGARLEQWLLEVLMGPITDADGN